MQTKIMNTRMLAMIVLQTKFGINFFKIYFFAIHRHDFVCLETNKRKPRISQGYKRLINFILWFIQSTALAFLYFLKDKFV